MDVMNIFHVWSGGTLRIGARILRLEGFVQGHCLFRLDGRPYCGSTVDPPINVDGITLTTKQFVEEVDGKRCYAKLEITSADEITIDPDDENVLRFPMEKAA
jgi:hypothetical protein